MRGNLKLRGGNTAYSAAFDEISAQDWAESLCESPENIHPIENSNETSSSHTNHVD
jgi:hypothetical protein